MTGKALPNINDPNDRGQSADRQTEQPVWLQKAKSLDDHESVEPLQEELVIKKDYHELFQAIRTRRKNAALYLVKHGVNLGAMNHIDIFQQLGSSEEACARLKMLGDVYAEAGKLREAISVYNFVEHEYSKLKDMIRNPLRPLLSKYALATTFVRAARELAPNELRARFQVSAADMILTPSKSRSAWEQATLEALREIMPQFFQSPRFPHDQVTILTPETKANLCRVVVEEEEERPRRSTRLPALSEEWNAR
ncbi:hypothetical protein QBC45DRAFT_484231 [Copromyces sp. CBS 386.78]|nr:hypothetical protein QBC45DRAFT_484231 [Copromyces sp. CBS 386.78]